MADTYDEPVYKPTLERNTTCAGGGVDHLLQDADPDNARGYDDDAIKRVSTIFQRFDANGDGQISYDELASVFESVDPEHWDSDSVARLLKAIDTGNDGQIRYEELLDWVMGTEEKWDEARASIMLKGKQVFCPGDVVFINQQVEKKKDTFEVEIDLSRGGKCGVVLDSPDSKCLLIKAVKEGGLLDEWNQEHSDNQISVRDRIIEITASVYLNAYEKGKNDLHVQVSQAKEGEPREMVALLSKKGAMLKFIIQPCETASAFTVKLKDNYQLLSTIHEGMTANVRKAKHIKTDKFYAVKSMSKSKLSKDHLQAEFELMLQLDHPNVLSLQEVFEDFHCIHLVLPLMEGGEVLEQVLENDKFSERQAARVLQQVLAGVRYLHSNSICHRDVKAENILLETPCSLDRANIKLIDFGSACIFREGQRMKDVVGTSEYNSVEMVGFFDGYTCLCDVWSCGIIMYLLLSGYPPFMGETDSETRTLIRANNLEFRAMDWKNISEDAQELIKLLLACETGKPKRPTADEAFSHSWVKDLAPKAALTSLDHIHLNIRSFSENSKMKKLALYALAKRLTSDEVEDLRRDFELVDKNMDGTVTFHEFKAMLDKRNEQSAADMRRLFEEVDVDGNKRIEYTEFLAAAVSQRLQFAEQSCWMAFNVFDHDGSGMISKKELKDILEKGDETMLSLTQTLGSTSESIARCLAECDQDMDGEIDFEEFMAMMRGDMLEEPETPVARRGKNVSRH